MHLRGPGLRDVERADRVYYAGPGVGCGGVSEFQKVAGGDAGAGEREAGVGGDYG